MQYSLFNFTLNYDKREVSSGTPFERPRCPDERPTPLKGPHVNANIVIKILITTPDERPPLL